MTQNLSGIPTWGSADTMFETTNKLLANADDLIKQLAAQQWYQPIVIGADYPKIAPPPSPKLPGVPTLQEVIWTVPNAPAAFNKLPPDIQGLFPGAFQGVQPTLNFGSQPQPAFGSIPVSPAVDLNFIYPDVSVTLPSPPTLLALDVIDFNPLDYEIGNFTGEVPTFNLRAPTIINYVEPPEYASGLLDDLTISLQSALTDDTDTGLTAQTQQAMWDAAREREYRQMGDAMEQLDRDQEQLGYALPSGVWNDNRLKLQTEMQNTTAGLSRDIMVKQAEMRLENVMKSRELAVGLEGKLIDYHNEIAQRVFEACKYETEAAISIYNAEVETFKSRLQGFQATIAAYEAGVRAIEARVQVLTAEVQFEQAKASINTALVEQYNGQIKAAEAVLDIARIKVEIIQTQANVEKTKVDIFSAQVQAFVATVNAYTAEVEGYKANAEAQQAIESVYKTQVDAYSAEVNASAQYASALIQGYNAQVQGYEAQLEGYKATLQAMVEQARAASEFNQAATAEYVANTQAIAAYNDVLVKTWQAILDEGMQIAQVEAKVAEANGQLAVSSRNISVEAIRGAAQVMAQLGAAALGAIHWSNSSQWGFSQSQSSSFSNSISNVDEHIFSESV